MKPSIYVFDDMPSFCDGMYYTLLPSIPAFRREKAEQYQQMQDRKLSIIAYLLLEHALKDECGVIGDIEFGYTVHGKPFLKGSEICFSISHCVCGAVCAVHNGEVGVDMQHIIPVSKTLMQRVCSDEEQKQINESGDPEYEFCRIWTRKESISKLNGTGITKNIKKITETGNVICETVTGQGDKPYIVTCAWLNA